MELLSAFGTDCAPAEEPETAEWACGDPVSYHGYDYTTVQIGEQCWFAENLRNEHYANGDAIPGELSDSEWQNTDDTNLGAQAIYSNDESNLANYGRLYNWYAVDDARGLCPAGWHVPTDGEWLDLKNYSIGQGFSGTYGTALKSLTGWYNGGNGTDDFGFSAPPGGVRYSGGNFSSGAGAYGYWWSSSSHGNVADYAYYWELVFDDPTTNQGACPLQYGFSVRCLKD
jgi:uncharacterized protein (TIGR02145 family)